MPRRLRIQYPGAMYHSRMHLGTSRSANNRLHAMMNQTAFGQPDQPTLGL